MNAGAPEAAKPEPERDLSEVIREVGESLRRLLRSGLNRNAIIVLVTDDTHVSRRNIRLVMDSLETLADRYVTKTKTTKGK